MTPCLISLAGPIRNTDSRVTVCAVVRNEMFFLDALFKHYRALGVRSFFVLDDGSTDESKEFLANQPDCTLFKSKYKFGQKIDGVRADVIWKQNLVSQLPHDAWALSVDADEFLMLDNAVELEALLDRLEGSDARTVLAAMIDLYPANIAQIRDTLIQRLDIGAEWYFDEGAYVAHGPEGCKPIVVGDGVKGRLTRRFGLAQKSAVPPWRNCFERLLGREAPMAQSFGYKTYKTPLLRNGPALRFWNSHWATPAPVTSDILPLAHYKFTANLQARIDWAIVSQVHSMGSQAFAVYARILERIEAEGGSFLFQGSRPMREPADFYTAGSAVRA